MSTIVEGICSGCGATVHEGQAHKCKACIISVSDKDEATVVLDFTIQKKSRWFLYFGLFSYIMAIIAWAATVTVCEMYPKRIYESFWIIVIFCWIIAAIVCIGYGCFCANEYFTKNFIV